MSTTPILRAFARSLENASAAMIRSRILPSNSHLPVTRSYFPPFRVSSFKTSNNAARYFHLNSSFRPNSLKPQFQPLRSLRLNSTKPPNSNSTTPPTQLNSPPQQTLSQRLKQLSREYGWTAVGVYLALSALDFPFCFLAVRLLGTERIGRWEHAIISAFWSVLAIPFPSLGQTPAPAGIEPGDAGEVAETVKREGQSPIWDHGVKEAQAANEGEEASIWTQLALAYAVHKSFVFIRVPLTAAVLPSVVRTLRAWGWKVGRRTPKVPPPS